MSIDKKYESALAASEGWIEWGGGECPVHEGANVDTKLEDGSEKSDAPASAFIWQHDDDVTNIIAYRLHKPDINSRANDDRLEQDLNDCIGQDVDNSDYVLCQILFSVCTSAPDVSARDAIKISECLSKLYMSTVNKN